MWVSLQVKQVENFRFCVHRKPDIVREVQFHIDGRLDSQRIEENDTQRSA